MAERKRYEYRPLDQSKNQIRLVEIINFGEIMLARERIHKDWELIGDESRIQQLEADIPIRICIRHVSLDNSLQKYAAFSYTWGEQTPKREVTVKENGQEFTLDVTTNLFQAILAIAENEHYWIDAICIDQEDNKEKSFQVRMMSRIFASADRVVAWLGPADNDSDLLISQMLKTLKLHTKHDPGRIQGISDVDYAHKLQAFFDWIPAPDCIPLVALYEFACRPYWRRVWVQQELAHNRKVRFYCGRRAKLTADAGPFLRSSYWANLDTVVEAKATKTMICTINGHRCDSGEKLGLATLLEEIAFENCRLEALHPRDHIFALVGMVDDAEEIGVIANYSRKLKDVYTQVARALVKQSGVKILTWLNKDQDKNVSLPSWVPDWQTPFLKPLTKFETNTPFKYGCSGNSLAWFTFETKDKVPLLCIWGYYIDTIAATSAEPNIRFEFTDLSWTTDDVRIDYAYPRKWIKDLQELAKDSVLAYGSPSGVNEAIWRTLITDVDFSERHEPIRATPDMKRGFELYQTGFIQSAAALIAFYPEQSKRHLTDRFFKSMTMQCSGRKFFVSTKGYLGVGPASAVKGDRIAVMLGMDTPLVLRETSNGHFRIQGEAYVHGVMDGEAMKGNVPKLFDVC